MTIYTARYANKALKGGGYLAVRISNTAPKFKLAYPLAGHCGILMPALEDCFGPNRHNFEAFKANYLALLDARDLPAISAVVERIRAAAEKAGRPAVLLCYEDIRKPGAFCHRRLFADWWREQTGEDIPELAEGDEEEGFQW